MFFDERKLLAGLVFLSGISAGSGRRPAARSLQCEFCSVPFQTAKGFHRHLIILHSDTFMARDGLTPVPAAEPAAPEATVRVSQGHAEGTRSEAPSRTAHRGCDVQSPSSSAGSSRQMASVLPSVPSAASINAVPFLSTVPAVGNSVSPLMSAEVGAGDILSRSVSASSLAVDLVTPRLRSSTPVWRSDDSSVLGEILTALRQCTDTTTVDVCSESPPGRRLFHPGTADCTRRRPSRHSRRGLRTYSRGPDGMRALRPFVGSLPTADIPRD